MIIYKVENVETGKIYIGKTSRELKYRKWAHYNSARNLNSNSNFHRALMKYPKKSFKWDIIATATSEDELNNLEIKSIKEYDTFKNGYNMTEGGTGGFVYNKESPMYEHIKHKLGKWENGNPGATPDAIAKRIETFKKKEDWACGELHGNYGRERLDLKGKPAYNSRPVIIDGVEYASTGVAARALGLKDSDVVRVRCHSTHKWKNYNYK